MKLHDLGGTLQGDDRFYEIVQQAGGGEKCRLYLRDVKKIEAKTQRNGTIVYHITLRNGGGENGEGTVIRAQMSFGTLQSLDAFSSYRVVSMT